MYLLEDETGRFAKRPYYPQRELDALLESTVETFLKRRYGRVHYPVSTDDLTRLIEESADDLDLYADLSKDGADVEGLTLFWPGKPPVVKISRVLASNPVRENRFRSALSHELAHVVVHTPLFAKSLPGLHSPDGTNSAFSQACKVANAGTSRDWMEWQAGYGSGALLIPRVAMFQTVEQFQRERGLKPGPIAANTILSYELIRRITTAFQTSTEIARRRLLEEGAILEPIPALEFLAKARPTRSSGLVHCSEILPSVAAPLGLRWYPTVEARFPASQESSKAKATKPGAA